MLQSQQSNNLDQRSRLFEVISPAARAWKVGGGPTHEEVISVWVWSTNSEKLHQVVKLTMDISADRYRAFLDTLLAGHRKMGSKDVAYHRLHIRLVLEDFSCLGTRVVRTRLYQISYFELSATH